MTYFDTHVLAWAYAGERERLGAAAARAIQEGDVMASPMAVLELEFLHEIGRLKPHASMVVEVLAGEIGLRICDLPFHIVARLGIQENWTRDPFDRLIVANARAADAALVTKDDRILRHYPRAVW